MRTPDPTRTIHCEDALAWLERQGPIQGASMVTSLPDASEFPGVALEEWKRWFVRAASLVLSRCPDDGVTLFYQSDIKREGVWIDKGYLCQQAAERAGHALLWHKVVCRVPVGNASFGRPGYTHLLCFSRAVRPDLASSTPDVLPEAGETTWTRGMGLEACRVACEFVLKHTRSRTIVDPFCGHGSVLAVANGLGLDAVGVELSRKRAKVARSLRVGDVAAGN